MGVQTVPQQGSEDRKAAQRRYLKYAGVGTQFGLTIVLFTLGGTWLDGKAETQPLFTILGVMLGFLGASMSLVYQVQGPAKEPEQTDEPEK